MAGSSSGSGSSDLASTVSTASSSSMSVVDEKALRAVKQFEQLALACATPARAGARAGGRVDDNEVVTEVQAPVPDAPMSNRAKAITAVLLEALQAGKAATSCTAATETGSIPEYVSWCLACFVHACSSASQRQQFTSRI